MMPAKTFNRHWKQAATAHSSARAEVSNAWSPRLRGVDGPVATLRTANSLSSRSAKSSPTTPTAYAKYIGRVGALAVALGVSGAVATTPGVAWADESSSPAVSSPTASESEPKASTQPSDELKIESSTRPTSTTSSKNSTDDESGDRFTKSGAPASPSQTVTTDESGVIVRSSGGAGTDATAPSADDNKPVGGSQEDTAPAPDLEQPTTPEEESTLQAPPETQAIAPPATPTRTIAPTEERSDTKQSDTKQVAPPAPPAQTIARAGDDSDQRQVATPSAPAASTEMGAAGLQVATAGETDEWTDQPVAAMFNAPPAPASSPPEQTNLIDALLAPFQGPGPKTPTESPVLWAVLGWVRRQFTGQFADRTPVADLAQTTQMEPLGTAEAAQVEGVSALAAAGPPIDTGEAAALIEAPTTTSIFFESSPRIGEANGTVLVPIVRTGDLTRASTIEYGITPDTATAGLDYVGGSGTITMQVGVDRVFIPVQILNDNLSEPTETFVVSIINVDSGSTILFPRTARIDILDDENPLVDPQAPPLNSNYNVTQQVVISGLDQPLAFEFAPPNPQNPSPIYVAEKGGVIKVFNVNTGAQQSTFIDISSKVNNIQDRGLMDIALHPNFGQPVQPGQPEHNYVYAFYVVDPPGTAGNPNPNAGPDGGGNRFAYLVRFTADAATNYTTAVPNSEVILLGGVAVPGVAALQPRTLQDISGAGAVDSTSNISQAESGFNAATGKYVDNYIKVDSRSHAGGSLAFGPDGALYVSIGDGTSFNTTDPRTVSVQNINSLSGKILRIDPLTGLGLPDNPFVEPGDDLSANHSKVYQLGLRNPFSMGFAQDGRLFISNTGWNAWEEIESGHAGANFGWPYFEGGDNGALLRAPGYQNLTSASQFYTSVANGTLTVTPAYRAFAHQENVPGFQLGAIVGFDAPYSGTPRYPAEFQNDIFFTDVNDGEVFVVDVNDRSDVKFLYSSEDFPVSFSQGPDGYVYVANLAGNLTRLLIAPVQPPPPPPAAVTLTPHGSASVANNVFTLTSGGAFQAGTAMSTGRIDVRQNFTVAFEVNLGASDGGADGAAIVFHNDPRGVNAVGAYGSGFAVGGIQNGLAIEFDTYNSAAGNLSDTGMPGSDIASDHTAFFGTNSAFATTPVPLANIENGAWHPVVVTWNATTQTMSYTFDGQPMGTPLTSNIATQFLGGSNFAYFGFGAGTGGLGNTQSVRNVTVAATFEGQAPGNSPPIAVADTATTTAGTPVVIAVLANDSDPDNNPLTIAAVSNFVNGTAAINPDKTITYTPTPGFTGSGGFTYTISDGTIAEIRASQRDGHPARQ